MRHEAGYAESYHVMSSRLGFFSEPTNEITVDFDSGLGDVAHDMPLAAAYEPGALRIVCATTHSNLRIYDASGRLVVQRQTVDNGEIFHLPAGIYIIVTDVHTRPVKAVVCD